MLNESGASERLSFVEQLETAFRTPARIDLRCSFPEPAVDIPPVPTLSVDAQDSSVVTTRISAGGPSTDDTEVSEPRSTLHSEDEEYCHHLNSLTDGPSVDIVRERPGNPLASSRNSRPSDGQLNRSFRFGGSPMPSERSDNSRSDGLSGPPLTLSDIIPPHSHQLPNNSGSSLFEEDSSVLDSIMAQANTVLPVASEVAVPECEHGSGRTPAFGTLLNRFRGTPLHHKPLTSLKLAQALLALTLSTRSVADSNSVQTGRCSTLLSVSLASTTTTTRYSASLRCLPSVRSSTTVPLIHSATPVTAGPRRRMCPFQCP